MAGLALADIFELHGESFYRRMEATAFQALEEKQQDGGLVLATGGGFVENQSIFERLLRNWLTVWLKIPPELHWRRVEEQGDTRPMRDRPFAMEELRRLWRQRSQEYQKCDLVLDNRLEASAVVGQLCQILNLIKDPQVTRIKLLLERVP